MPQVRFPSERLKDVVIDTTSLVIVLSVFGLGGSTKVIHSAPVIVVISFRARARALSFHPSPFLPLSLSLCLSPSLSSPSLVLGRCALVFRGGASP